MANYSNEGFDLDVWSAREKLSEETVAALYREKIVSYEAISRLEEGDIKDLGLPIGERALLRGAVKNLPLMHRTPGVVSKPPAPVRRVAPAAPRPGSFPLPSRSGLGAPSGPASPIEPDYETIPYDRLTREFNLPVW